MICRRWADTDPLKNIAEAIRQGSPPRSGTQTFPEQMEMTCGTFLHVAISFP